MLNALCDPLDDKLTVCETPNVVPSIKPSTAAHCILLCSLSR